MNERAAWCEPSVSFPGNRLESGALRAAPGLLIPGPMGRVLLTATLLVAGCHLGSEPPLSAEFGLCATETPAPDVPAAPTYWEHVKPILDAKCAPCHREGDIAPFALATYEDALLRMDAIGRTVRDGVMPPWPPDPCRNEYRFDRSLTPEQKETLLAWVRALGPEGDPASEGPPLDVDLGGLSRVDATLTMKEPFTPEPKIGVDEVRCFLLDWPFDEEVYVTGLNVRPGNRQLVHHVIVFTVDESDAAELEELDGADGRPGWDCTGAFAGWAPGYRGVEFPDGLGRRVPPRSRVVLNVHYDTGKVMEPDQTTVELMIADRVEKELEGTGVLNPQWLVGEGMRIEAGDPDAMVFFSYDPTTVLTKGKPFRIHAVNLHMHELGSMARLAILRQDGTEECLYNDTNWDFDWIGEYWLADPPVFQPGDRLYVECHWDNTAPNQKIVNGELQEPRDIGWGTDEEMCAGILTITTVDE